MIVQMDPSRDIDATAADAVPSADTAAAPARDAPLAIGWYLWSVP
jgi:hypothetical protein